MSGATPRQLFSSARNKIARAEEQADALNVEMQQVAAMHHDSVRYDVEDDGVVVARFVAPELPAEWSVRIGEILHDLRSALDHAVTDLTIAETGGELPGTEFPIFRDPALWSECQRKTGDPTRRSGLHKTRGVGVPAQSVIEQLQPFHWTDPTNVPVLQVLHDLNIRDKHQALHLLTQRTDASTTLVVRDIHPISNTLVFFGAMEDGAELGRWLPADPAPGEVDVQFDLVLEVVFGEDTPHVHDQPVRGQVEGLIRGVTRVLDYLGGRLSVPGYTGPPLVHLEPPLFVENGV